ncbi:helix-turn-helix domain-containing protein [Streptomyces qinzhouensis]|nr:helix-turn-helix transcriptional regulator [Streptomyces qinzhouensis]
MRPNTSQALGRAVKSARVRAGLTQQQLGTACAMSQSSISRIEHGQHSPSPAELQAIAHALGTDASALRAESEGEIGWLQRDAEIRQRALPGGTTAGPVPVFDLVALEHLTAVAQNARRYSDAELVSHLRSALDATASADIQAGPHHALPTTLGILATINNVVRESTSEIRRELLALGARAAELAAWLHRDVGAPEQATTYWHHQAKEWATLSGDNPMHAYVLLRQAQATDRTDPARMRDLAHAAANGPWKLPPRPRAEALQQEARALALTGASHDDIERTLDRAQNALAQATPPSGQPTCTGPLGDGYTTDRLMVQTAICYRESGQYDKAVPLFQQHLARDVFAPRDRAFFTAHLAGSLASAEEPDEAARTASRALVVAAPSRFGQALTELRRTCVLLQPHYERPAVRELYDGMKAWGAV